MAMQSHSHSTAYVLPWAHCLTLWELMSSSTVAQMEGFHERAYKSTWDRP